MKTTLMNEEQLVKKATDILLKQLGPLESSRFLSLPHPKRMESVKRHREWQKNLNKDALFNKVF